MAVNSIVQPSHHFRPLHERSWGARQWLHLSYSLVGTFFRVWCCLRIEGDEHIPRQDSVLFASNHLSLLDALLIPYTVMATQGLQIVWSPAKEELFHLPLIGRILTSWGAFPVRRGRSDLAAMRRIITLLHTGKMMLFPEGTRSPDGRLGPGKRTVGKFIYKARPAVIPTVVHGTERILPKGAYLPCFRLPICVRYGQPLDLQRYYALPDTKQTAEAIVQEVMGAIAALQQAPSGPARLDRHP
jgi:1-acyl-sn-glycerol-3-phosphate acyltransferase